MNIDVSLASVANLKVERLARSDCPEQCFANGYGKRIDIA